MHHSTSLQTSLAERIAAFKANQLNTNPRDETAESVEFPLECLLYLYIKTPANAYSERDLYFSRLYDWLAPIAKPVCPKSTAKRHHLTEGRVQRYIANLTSTPLEDVQYTIKHKVYPMLGDDYEY